MALAGIIVSGSGGGRLLSSGATYAVAREGTGTKRVTAAARGVGQQRTSNPTSYSVFQTALAFDVSALGSLIIEAAYLQIKPWSIGTGPVIEAVALDWGAVLDVGDFVPGSALESIVRYGSVNTASASAYYQAGRGGRGGNGTVYNNDGLPGSPGAVRLTYLGGYVTWTTAGTDSWTCPTGITQVYVEAWGAGGGGGQGASGSSGAGGGGGAYAASWVTVTPGNAYQVLVGAGGGGNGGNGADSKFNLTSVVADGGYGASWSTPGAGGSASSSVGTTKVDGVAGAVSYDTSGGIGGGPGAALPLRFTNAGAALHEALQYPHNRGDAFRLMFTPEAQRTGTAPSGSEYTDFGGRSASDFELVLLHSGNRRLEFTTTVSRAAVSAADSMSFSAECRRRAVCHLRANIARPRSDSVKAFDFARTYMGILPGAVEVAANLDGPDELRVEVPWTYGRADGATESRVGMITLGWYLAHDGEWYRVTNLGKQPGSNRLSVTARSAEFDLDRFLTNYGQIPFSLKAHTPTEIATAVLSGQPECDWYNGDFALLGDDGFPLGWTGDGWSLYNPDGEHTLETTAEAATLTSEGIRHTAGAEIKPLLEIWVGANWSGRVQLVASWQNALGAQNHSDTCDVPYSEEEWFSFEAPDWWAVRNERCRLSVVLSDNTALETVRVRRVRFRQNEEATEWAYSGELDTRAPDIPYNDALFVRYGGWALDAVSEVIEASTAGDMLARPFTGDLITVVFAAGEAGALCDILIDGKEHIKSLDVSAARTYEIVGLNRYRPHLLEVIVKAGTVRVAGLVQSTENRIAVQWNRRPVYQALLDLQDQVGGEFEFDTRDRIIFHTKQRGIDLTDTNLLWLQEGVNLGDLSVQTDQIELGNRAYGGGYGDGAFQLGAVVDADATDDDGLTSQERFGVLRFPYTNKEALDLATLAEDTRREANSRAFPADTYSATLPDDLAAYLHPGDTVRVTHTALGTDGAKATRKLRVLRVVRSSAGAARVTFGARPPVEVGAQYAALWRSVDRLGG